MVVADQVEESLHNTVEPLRMRGLRLLRSDRVHNGDRYPSESDPVSRDTGHSIEEIDRGLTPRLFGSRVSFEEPRRPDRRGQAPKGTGGMPRRHQRDRRGRLRYVRGSCPTNVDPGMPVETRGTETSQYPEERKSTETPSVAASERGSA